MHLCLFQRNNGGRTLRVKLVKPEEMQFLFLFSSPGKAVPTRTMTSWKWVVVGGKRPFTFLLRANCAGIFKQSMGARNRVGIGLPPGYIGWRNSFLGIDSWAP